MPESVFCHKNCHVQGDIVADQKGGGDLLSMMFTGAFLFRTGTIWSMSVREVPHALRRITRCGGSRAAEEHRAQNQFVMDLCLQGLELKAAGRRQFLLYAQELVELCPGLMFSNSTSTSSSTSTCTSSTSTSTSTNTNTSTSTSRG